MWRRASFCSAESSTTEQCVEVETSWAPGEIGVSDSKHPDGPVLVFSHDEWVAFVAGVKAGEFDPV